MLANLSCWRFANRIGSANVLLTGLALTMIIPLFYGSAPTVLTMAFVYGLNGISFWIIQTAEFGFAGRHNSRRQKRAVFWEMQYCNGSELGSSKILRRRTPCRHPNPQFRHIYLEYLREHFIRIANHVVDRIRLISRKGRKAKDER